MKFCTMNIPISVKRENETNEDTFLRIMETWNGEYIEKWEEFTYAALGEWVRKCDKRFKNGTFPVAWIEDDNENITEYFVYLKKGNAKILRHREETI